MLEVLNEPVITEMSPFSKKRYATVRIKTKRNVSVTSSVREKRETKLLRSRPRRSRKKKSRARSLAVDS